jgi:hypothetical protein
MTPVYKRLSFLKRSASLSRAQFFAHYESLHGPLASRQAGFRKFTYRYVQNHFVREALREDDPEFDGMTATWQVPRADMRRGFFQEPDYARFVRPDEERLFDLAKTRSMLAIEHVLREGGPTTSKSVCLYVSDRPGAALHSKLAGAVRIAINEVVPDTASALGGVAGGFEFNRVAEIWFDEPLRMLQATEDEHFVQTLDDGSTGRGHVFLAREVVIFSEPPGARTGDGT